MSRRSPLAALSFPALVAGALCACRVGPDYERPEYPVPESYRGLEGEPAESGGATGAPEASYGDREWFEVFDDPVLVDLIEQALAGNYDVRIAAERVLEARAFVTIERAELFPDVQGGATYDNTRLTENAANPVLPFVENPQEQWSAFGNLTWEIDFWGRIRSASDAARADLLATELARRAVVQTLVSDLALAYFDLLELDQELAITKRTYDSRQRSFELVTLRLERGVANKVEARQAEGLVIQTAGLIPFFEQRIEQQENLIRLLIGGNPGPIPRGRPLLEQDRGVDVPMGLPSDLLARRPDVVAAEQALVAANARIGEARALLYPSIRLTAFGGVASEDLGDLFESGSGVWNIQPSLTAPIFNAGRLRSNVKVTESRQRQAAMSYLQTLQRSFREVADALIAHEKTAEARVWRQRLEETLRDQVALSNNRYVGGVTSYLEVLDSERNHFDAEIALAQAIRDELFAGVFLYRALGGGWQGTEELAARGPQEGASGVSGEPEAPGDTSGG